MADLAAVQAYQAAVRAAQQSNMGTQPEPTSGLDFGNMVTSAIADTTGFCGQCRTDVGCRSGR